MPDYLAHMVLLSFLSTGLRLCRPNSIKRCDFQLHKPRDATHEGKKEGDAEAPPEVAALM
jgi:hypothetical protein